MSSPPDGDLTPTSAPRRLTDEARAHRAPPVPDESGQLSEQRLLALGGAALRDRDWHALRDLWQWTLARHSWPADREVKWHGIRTGAVPPALADAIVAAIRPLARVLLRDPARLRAWLHRHA
jgi:hypothetical protein